jgi:hypothetical protein
MSNSERSGIGHGAWALALIGHRTYALERSRHYRPADVAKLEAAEKRVKNPAARKRRK